MRYFRTSEMSDGGPFKCYNCNKTLLIKVSGDRYRIDMKCPRCKAFVHIHMKEQIPKETQQEAVPA